MTFVQMHSLPGLFVGRRTVLTALPASEGARAYRCGDCSGLLGLPNDRPAENEFVVRCDCGAINRI
jgi:hypothetical protein